MSFTDTAIPPLITDAGPLPPRALSVTEILDTTVRQVRKHQWFMTLPIFGFLLPIVLIEGAMGINHTITFTNYLEGSASGFLGTGGIFPDLRSLFLWALFNGITMPLVTVWLEVNAHRHLVALKPSVIPHIRTLLLAYLTWLITQGLIWIPIMIFGFFGSTFFGEAGRSGDVSGVSALFGVLVIIFIALTPVWTLWQALTFLAPGIAIAEQINPFKATIRAMVLFKRCFGVVVGTYLALTITIQLVSSLVAAVPTAVLSLPNDYVWATQGVAIVFATAITQPIYAMALMILVRDVNIRADGADLHHRIDKLINPKTTLSEADIAPTPQPGVAASSAVSWGSHDS